MVKGFTKQDSANIQRKLNKRLSPELLSQRTGFGSSKLTYLEGWLVISLANHIFGFDGWSSKIKKIKTDFLDEINGKVSVGISCICKVTLKDGTFKEDIGYGMADNQKSKGIAFEKAKKEASTDALKRTLRQFGNVLGNCCYDKDYLHEIIKFKKENKVSIDPQKLFKRSDLNCTEDNNFNDSLFSDL